MWPKTKLEKSNLERQLLSPVLLTIWALSTFISIFWARDLEQIFFGWPFNFWLGAHGLVILYIFIVVFYAWRMNKLDNISISFLETENIKNRHLRLFKWMLLYTIAILCFMSIMIAVESAGLSRNWIGGLFLICTVLLYSIIGIYNRTSDPVEYYVAGRRIPAVYNGMASAADWMSAATFISLAGGLYLQGFSGANGEPGGLAYILGWTGGFCLVALIIAPKLRQYEVFTIPDFFGARFGGKWPRITAAIAAIICSFIYIVAQIYGVGLITSRLTGVQFEIGILLGLGGVLVCSFLGGMKAVTWTQVAQYVVLFLAYLIPVSWMSYQQLGNPVAPIAYGQQLAKIEKLEHQLIDSPAEKTVIEEYRRRADEYQVKLKDVGSALALERRLAQDKLRTLNRERADPSVIFAASRELASLPRDTETAKARWTLAMNENLRKAQDLAGVPRQSQAFDGDPNGTDQEKERFNNSRLNFLALVFCLMTGTMGLPHLLTRFFATSSVAETRNSVAWSLIFIAIIYLSAPALAVLAKYQVMTELVGQNFSDLPNWIAQWSKLDGNLISVSDINGDGILQFAELHLGADIIVLAAPELGVMPYVVSGLVAAGGLAAALSTADGLLLTIGNAFAHDLFRYGKNDKRNMMRRVMFSKFILMLAALLAAYVATQKPAGILFLVAASFSLAGSAFVPAMVLGLLWKRTTRQAAVAGMWVGLSVTVAYMFVNTTGMADWLGWHGNTKILGINPISSAVFGLPAGFLTVIAVTLFGKSNRQIV
jgi:cation/acetate symporter